jgi:hypothetical protein
MEHTTDGSNVGWLISWSVAVAVLFALGLRLPLRGRGRGARWRAIGWVVAGAVTSIVAAVALVLHDTHLDLTREKVFTPAAQALAVVEGLKRPVKLTYFYRAQDPNGRRLRDIVGVMARRSPLLDARSVDPDKEPTLAETAGVKLYNAAVIEADGRRVLVNTVDENEIAIGIQRVLRERVPTVCFVEGHGELPMENFEFHTHMEGLADHSHGDVASKVVEMRGHGSGRVRRALEAQGFVTRRVLLAAQSEVPAACGVVVIASPRDTFVPAEADALRAFLARGGGLFAAFDLGFAPEPRLAALLADLGVRLPQQVVIDPLSHYTRDPEMVAVAGYDPHPVTQPLSMTFYPGVRPLELVAPAAGLTVVPLLASSRDSYVRAVATTESRVVAPRTAAGTAARSDTGTGPRVLGVAVEGALPGSDPTHAMRAVVVGDGDFLSNSFLPYLSNAELVLSSMRWLLHEEKGAAVSTRIPVPPLVLLTPAQTRGIFVVVEVLLPLAVIAIGVVIWWRRR